MMKRHRVAGLVLAMGLAVMPVLAQEAAKKEPPKPAPSPSQAVLEQWNEIGRKLVAIAEDLPEDKYDYKPNPDSRTFRGVLLHVSASMYYFTDFALGKKFVSMDGLASVSSLSDSSSLMLGRRQSWKPASTRPSA